MDEWVQSLRSFRLLFSLTGGPLHVSISYQKVDSNAEYENNQNSGKEIVVDKEGTKHVIQKV